MYSSRNIFTLRILNGLQRGSFHARFLCKRNRSRSGHAIFVRNLGRWPDNLFFHVWLGGQQLFDQHCKPSRRGIACRRAVHPSPDVHASALFDALRQLRLCGGNHAGRYFFQSNFKEKLPSSGILTRFLHSRCPILSRSLRKGGKPQMYISRNAALLRCIRLRNSHGNARILAITPTRSVTEIAPRASSKLNRCEHFRHRSKH